MCGAETWVSSDIFNIVYVFTNFIVQKVNFTLEQVMEAQRVSRGIAQLLL